MYRWLMQWCQIQFRPEGFALQYWFGVNVAHWIAVLSIVIKLAISSAERGRYGSA